MGPAINFTFGETKHEVRTTDIFAEHLTLTYSLDNDTPLKGYAMRGYAMRGYAIDRNHQFRSMLDAGAICRGTDNVGAGNKWPRALGTGLKLIGNRCITGNARGKTGKGGRF